MTELAAEERRELCLGPMDPLNPYDLCEAHGIDVYAIEDLEDPWCGRETIEHFAVQRASTWSAALIPIGTARVIIENTAHEPPRRRSNIAHELGHHLLEHEFAQVLIGEDHNRLVDQKVEKEALFLSGELLIPGEACRKMAFRGWDNAAIAAQFGVSPQFAQMRMKGFRVMAERALRKQARA